MMAYVSYQLLASVTIVYCTKQNQIQASETETLDFKFWAPKLAEGTPSAMTCMQQPILKSSCGYVPFNRFCGCVHPHLCFNCITM